MITIATLYLLTLTFGGISVGFIRQAIQLDPYRFDLCSARWIIALISFIIAANLSYTAAEKFDDYLEPPHQPQQQPNQKHDKQNKTD